MKKLFKAIKQLLCKHNFEYVCFAGHAFNHAYQKLCSTNDRCFVCANGYKRCKTCGKLIKCKEY